MDAHTSSYLTVARRGRAAVGLRVDGQEEVATGEIRAVKLSTAGRGAVRIPEEGLETWLRSVRRPSHSPEAA